MLTRVQDVVNAQRTIEYTNITLHMEQPRRFCRQPHADFDTSVRGHGFVEGDRRRLGEVVIHTFMSNARLTCSSRLENGRQQGRRPQPIRGWMSCEGRRTSGLRQDKQDAEIGQLCFLDTFGTTPYGRR